MQFVSGLALKARRRTREAGAPPRSEPPPQGAGVAPRDARTLLLSCAGAHFHGDGARSRRPLCGFEWKRVSNTHWLGGSDVRTCRTPSLWLARWRRYGINDCEAKVGEMPMAEVWRMLRPVAGENAVC